MEANERKRAMQPEPMDLSESEAAVPQKNRRCNRCHVEKLTAENVKENKVTWTECRLIMYEKKQEQGQKCLKLLITRLSSYFLKHIFTNYFVFFLQYTEEIFNNCLTALEILDS